MTDAEFWDTVGRIPEYRAQATRESYRFWPVGKRTMRNAADIRKFIANRALYLSAQKELVS